jgi:hypothetical protein
MYLSTFFLLSGRVGDSLRARRGFDALICGPDRIRTGDLVLDRDVC